MMEVNQRIDELSRQLLEYQRLYYVENRPAISDRQYDLLFDELLRLEGAHPEWVRANSPSRRIGSDLDQLLVDRPHLIPVLSLDKVYQAGELLAWARKVLASVPGESGFTVEEKVDGASIVLYYRDGQLEYALTRGNGLRGNDVTENVRTIGQVPLQIAEKAPLAVRGEIFLNREEFHRLNRLQETPFANPRNLAAGTLRSVRSRSVAQVPLRFVAYEAHFQQIDIGGQSESLHRLAGLGFPLPLALAFFCDSEGPRATFLGYFPDKRCASLDELPDFLAERTRSRGELPYDTDGLVVKLDSIPLRQSLGSTSHHPRWAMAFKFDAPQAETVLLGVQVQVGRNGRVTPVALLKPVALSGSQVSRATLHNQEYIDSLELGIGDRVAISRRGDVIPAVDEVVEKAEHTPGVFRLPASCPFCATALTRIGAHHFCPNEECPQRQLRALVHFTGKGGLDIDSLGEKTLALLFSRGWIRTPADLMEFAPEKLRGVPGFAEKKIDRIARSLLEARKAPFSRLLIALGFESLGPSVIDALFQAGFRSLEDLTAAAAGGDPAVFSNIPGIGPILGEALVRHLTAAGPLNQLGRLAALGFSMAAGPLPANPAPRPGIFSGQVWVLTGTLDSFSPRAKAAHEIESRGGKVAPRITADTTHLLCGEDPGSKRTQAQKNGVTIVSEETFLLWLEEDRGPTPAGEGPRKSG